MCSRDFPCSGSSLRLRMIVGCGPPNPSRGPISTEPSSSRSSTTKSRTSHQNRASTSGSRQPSTSSLIRHAMNETCSQPGNCREDHTRTSWAPSSENNPAIVPDEASTGEMISGPTLSGQPGKAVGHAVGELTLRHDLVARPVVAPGRARVVAWPELASGQCNLECDPCLHVHAQVTILGLGPQHPVAAVPFLPVAVG